MLVTSMFIIKLRCNWPRCLGMREYQCFCQLTGVAMRGAMCVLLESYREYERRRPSLLLTNRCSRHNGSGIVDWHALAAALANFGPLVWRLAQPQPVFPAVSRKVRFGSGSTTLWLWDGSNVRLNAGQISNAEDFSCHP
jgi:hypothetical protein